MSVPIGPYTPIVTAGPWLICSGQLGLDQQSAGPGPSLVEGGAPAQLAQALANAGGLLAGKDAVPADVVKTTVFLADMADAPAVNEAYLAFFGDHRPARSMVAVAGLPLGALVEVELWAYRDPS